MIVAVTADVTTVELITKVAEVAPAGTVTLVCTGAFVLFDDKLIPTPPVAAGPVSVTVPVVLPPPTRVAGDNVTLANAGAVMVSVAVLDELLSPAVMTAVFVLWSAVVVTVNVADVAPPATVTETGTAA